MSRSKKVDGMRILKKKLSISLGRRYVEEVQKRTSETFSNKTYKYVISVDNQWGVV